MIKSFKLFESDSQIEMICEDLGIKNFKIVDGLVNVDDNVYLNNRRLTKLPIKFGEVSGEFHCSNNRLISLDGCPKRVGEIFNCDYNELTSLKGGPNWVGGDFSCDSNSLTNLKGFPEKVGGNFWCQYNNIFDFRGIGENSLGVYNKFICRSNPIYEIYRLFEDSESIDLINEYGVIVNGNVIIKDRLEEVFYVLGIEIPEKLEFRNYKLI